LNKKKIILVLVVALAALLLSACGGRSTIVNTWSGLSADAERAYLASGSHVYGVDAATGKEIWRFPLETDSNLLFYANPVLTEDGQLLVGSEGNTHELVSLNPATGKENWVEPFLDAKGRWVASPLVLNERIYAPNSDGFLYTLDLKTGQSVADPIELGGALWATPISDGELIYVTSLDHHLHIIDPATGETAEPLDLGGASPSSPVVGEDGVYIGSFDSTIQFVTPSGENEIIATAPDWIWGTPSLDNGVLYYADLSGNLFALDLESNTQLWNELKTDGSVVANLLVVEDQIYIATETGTLVALDREAKIVWEKTPGGKLYTSPVFTNGLILVAPYRAEDSLALTAYDAEGKQVWSFIPEQ
jgi:outer membrane protein assembly factor BamB